MAATELATVAWTFAEGALKCHTKFEDTFCVRRTFSYNDLAILSLSYDCCLSSMASNLVSYAGWAFLPGVRTLVLLLSTIDGLYLCSISPSVKTDTTLRS